MNQVGTLAMINSICFQKAAALLLDFLTFLSRHRTGFPRLRQTEKLRFKDILDKERNLHRRHAVPSGILISQQARVGLQACEMSYLLSALLLFHVSLVLSLTRVLTLLEPANSKTAPICSV